MEDDYALDAEQLGVATALERTCMLEARLRQAIQDTHVISRDFDHDADSVDRELDALLAVRDQLELLEDKLREYSALGKQQYEDKTVVLSQLDSRRRELINIARDSMLSVTFAKDVVREVRAFAEMRAEDELSSDAGYSETDTDGELEDVSDALAASSASGGSRRLSGSGSMRASGEAHPEWVDDLAGSETPEQAAQTWQQQHAERDGWQDEEPPPPLPPPRPATAEAQVPRRPRRSAEGGAAAHPEPAAARAPHRSAAAGLAASGSRPARPAAPAAAAAAARYESAADRILAGGRPPVGSGHLSAADRILSGRPAVSGSLDLPPGATDEAYQVSEAPAGRPRSASPDAGPAKSRASGHAAPRSQDGSAQRRSPSVKGPPTPSTAARGADRGAGGGPAEASPRWAREQQAAWRPAQGQEPAASHTRYDHDAYDRSSSDMATDDPQYGGKVDMQGFAATSPANGSASRTPQPTLRVRDGSVRRRDDAGSAADQAAVAPVAANTGRSRRLRCAVTAVVSALAGAGIAALLQGNNASSGSSSHHGELSPAEMGLYWEAAEPPKRQGDSKRAQHSTPFPPLPPPDVNLGRG